MPSSQMPPSDKNNLNTQTTSTSFVLTPTWLDTSKIATTTDAKSPHLQRLIQQIQAHTLQTAANGIQDKLPIAANTLTLALSSLRVARFVSQLNWQGQPKNPDTQNNLDGNLPTQILHRLIDSPITHAAVLVAITNEAKPRLLLTRRAAHINAHAGEVAFAGGKYEAADSNNVMTALRESYEETALQPHTVKLIGQLPVQLSRSGLSVRPIVAMIDPPTQATALVAEPNEIARIFWADLDTLITQPTQNYQISYQIAGKPLRLSTPCWQIDGETLWGLTGRMTASLLEIGFDRKIDWYYRADNLPAGLYKLYRFAKKRTQRVTGYVSSAKNKVSKNNAHKRK